MDLVLHTSINSSDILIIECCSNNLDASNVRQFKDNIQAGLGEHTKVVLDMSGVKFVDSSGLGGLISCLRLLNSRNGDFRLCNMSTSVRALFELMRMHRVFTILASREDAIHSYS